MALTVREQLKYWGIAAIIFAVTLWYLGDVLLRSATLSAVNLRHAPS